MTKLEKEIELEKELCEIKVAISAVLQNQSYSLDGMQFTRANLKTLNEMRTAKINEIATFQGRGKRRATVFDFSGTSI